MACRCNEVGKCDQDIRYLERDLAQELNTAQRNSSLGTAMMPALRGDLANAAFVTNMLRIETRLAALKKNQDNYANNCLSKRSGELTRIRSRRNNYEYEDRRYHEMMEQRAKR